MEEIVDENKILPMMGHDRIDFLFRMVYKKLQLYVTQNLNDIAIHFMSYDHKQVIAALNDNELLEDLADDIK